MKVALFEPSDSLRALIRHIAQQQVALNWVEFVSFDSNAQSCIVTEYVDAVVTANRLGDDKSYRDVIQALRSSTLNAEAPVFVIASEPDEAFIGSAFQQGATEVFSRAEIGALTSIFSDIATYPTRMKDAAILLVEDSSSMAAYYQEVLATFGFLVTHHASCALALAAMHKAGNIELVITDLNLGSGGQGQRLVRDIRRSEHDSLSHVPIIVMSSSSVNQHQTGLFYMGVDDYLVKPIPPRQLCLRAAHLIEKYRIEQTMLAQAEEFKQAAQYDRLTRLYNRRGFLEMAQRCVAGVTRQGIQVGVLLLDLDHFKQANDRHGHAAGDKVLCDVAVLLKDILREQDVVARWGGDEFVALLYDSDPAFLTAIADRVQTEFTAHQDQLLDVGASIGLAHGQPHCLRELLTLVDCADQGLYSAKEDGRGTNVLTATCTLPSSERAKKAL